jgi:hypothetical protein
MLNTDQVATAPCTDPLQVRFWTFEAKPQQSQTWTSHDWDLIPLDSLGSFR